MQVKVQQKGAFFLAGCSALSGVLLYLSFPPVDMWWLSFVALVPLLVILPMTRSQLVAAFYGGVAGLLFYVPALFWLASVTVGGWLLLAVYLTGYFCLFGAVARLLSGRAKRAYPFLLPFIWVGLEFIRATAFTGFPWFLYGYTQYRFQLLLQSASVLGAYGLSFLLVFVNVAAAQIFRGIFARETLGVTSKVCLLRRGGVMSGLSAFLLLCALLFGWSALDGLEMQEGPVFGVVQQNMPPAMTPPDVRRIYAMSEEEMASLPDFRRRELWDRLEGYFDEYDRRARAEVDAAVRLSRELADSGVKLIAWPETTVEAPLNPEAIAIIGKRGQERRDYALSAIESLAKELDCYLLIGSTFDKKVGESAESANTAYLFSPAGQMIGHYNKIRLVPFGEYTPGRELLPGPALSLLESFAIAQSRPGADPVVFSEPLSFSASICYDNVFSDLMRTFRRRGAKVLVNISNEGWYHIRGELEQHLAMAVFRAVETRTTVVRATNTGISGFIDPAGVIYGVVSQDKDGRQVRKNVEGALALPVMLASDKPPYVRWGDRFAYFCVFLAVLSVAWVNVKMPPF